MNIHSRSFNHSSSGARDVRTLSVVSELPTGAPVAAGDLSGGDPQHRVLVATRNHLNCDEEAAIPVAERINIKCDRLESGFIALQSMIAKFLPPSPPFSDDCRRSTSLTTTSLPGEILEQIIASQIHQEQIASRQAFFKAKILQPLLILHPIWQTQPESFYLPSLQSCELERMIGGNLDKSSCRSDGEEFQISSSLNADTNAIMEEDETELEDQGSEDEVDASLEPRYASIVVKINDDFFFVEEIAAAPMVTEAEGANKSMPSTKPPSTPFRPPRLEVVTDAIHSLQTEAADDALINGSHFSHSSISSSMIEDVQLAPPQAEIMAPSSVMEAAQITILAVMGASCILVFDPGGVMETKPHHSRASPKPPWREMTFELWTVRILKGGVLLRVQLTRTLPAQPQPPNRHSPASATASDSSLGRCFPPSSSIQLLLRP